VIGSIPWSFSTLDVIHRVCLTPDSDCEAFRWWVQLNHAANPVAELAPHVRFPSRVEGPAALCDGDVSSLSAKDFRVLVRRLVEAEIPSRFLSAMTAWCSARQYAPIAFATMAVGSILEMTTADCSCGSRDLARSFFIGRLAPRIGSSKLTIPRATSSALSHLLAGAIRKSGMPPSSN